MRRNLLVVMLGVLGTLSVIAVASVMFSSMSPSAAKLAEYEMEVDLSSAHEGTPIDLIWHGWRVFIFQGASPSVYWIPTKDGTVNGIVLLPDPTWKHAVFACKEFGFLAGKFRCNDSELDQWWRTNAQWTADGQNLTGQLPPLQSPQFTVEGKSLILGKRTPI